MYYRMIRNDVAKSKLITLTTLAFVVVAAMLVSLAAVLIVNLMGSIDTLMARAETPHFMQMHTGAIDGARIANFAEQNGGVDEFQVLEFLNVAGAEIVIEGESLVGSLQDNGLCVQSSRFDYLLDLDGNIIQAKEGEIYVPICYMKDGTAKVGDNALICGIPFTVAGFLRDSQMNSTLSSSKRFLVSEDDYAQVRDLGEMEYLIEFRLKDQSALSTFETAYSSAGLEANGPTITYPLFRMINAIDDGLMIAVILLVSVLVVCITFMCIRFTLLAKVEDDYREIGVMKAIGLRLSDIKRIYVAKYAAISVVGCGLGFALSYGLRGALLENIRLYMGQSENAGLAQVLAFVGVGLVFLAIVMYVRRVLRKLSVISAAQALRYGIAQEMGSGARRLRLSKQGWVGVNAFLALKDVLSRKKLYGTMFTVLTLAAFIMIVPQNMHNTIVSDEFASHMGIGKCDILIGVQQTDNIVEKTAGIADVMSKDSRIAQYVVLTTKMVQVKMEDGSLQRIKIELGDHTLLPVTYTQGKPPETESEIALSVLNADALGKKVGDLITLSPAAQEKYLTVCGIYSDITNGGKTAKANFTEQSPDVMWGMICAKLSDTADTASVVKDYTGRFGFAKVSDIHAHFTQTLGGTIRSVERASYASTIVSLAVAALITLLFMKMLIAKDRYSIAIMKALGFTSHDITIQFIVRSAFVSILGIVVGTLLANTLGELLTSALISSLGASSFQFVVNPLSAYLLCPVMMICAVLLATLASTSSVGRINISENIKE